MPKLTSNLWINRLSSYHKCFCVSLCVNGRPSFYVHTLEERGGESGGKTFPECTNMDPIRKREREGGMTG